MEPNFSIPENEIATLAGLIDRIFSANDRETLTTVQLSLEQIRYDPQITKQSELIFVIEAIGNLFLGMGNLRAQNHDQAYQFLDAASSALEQIEVSLLPQIVGAFRENTEQAPAIRDLPKLASAFRDHAEAIVNLQQSNTKRAQELYASARQKLRDASKYGGQFEFLIDHMEPDMLFIGMLEALDQHDFRRAKIMSSQASKASENVAQHYYDESDEGFHAFMGFGHLYRSFYTLAEAFRDFNLFRFRDLAVRTGLADDAVKAQELLHRAGSSMPVVQHNHAMSKYIAASLTLLREFADYLDGIVSAASSKKLHNPAQITALRRDAQVAIDLATETGMGGIALVQLVENLKHQIDSLDGMVSKPGASVSSVRPSLSTSKAKIFLVHGHNHAARESVARFLERLEIRVTILQDEATKGRTILDKLAEHADESNFAVILLTADDRGGTAATPYEGQKQRARQNVVFELGYFLALLGKDRVCAIHEEGVEVPSDYSGIIFIPYDPHAAWRLFLARELKGAGFDIDLNKAV